jgi:hypothetical protein
MVQIVPNVSLYRRFFIGSLCHLDPTLHAFDLVESPRVKVGLAEEGGADKATHKLATGHHAVRGDRVVDRFECDENLPLARTHKATTRAGQIKTHSSAEKMSIHIEIKVMR